MITTLAELIAPVTLAEFLSSSRARRRLYIPAFDSTRTTSLISWQDIDVLVQMHARDNKLIVQRDGMSVPPQLYTALVPDRRAPTGKSNKFNARAFHDLLAQGVSVIVNSIEHLVPQIGQLTAAIERELGIRTDANGYVSFSKGGAFKPHRDHHDVLVVQVHGKKQWRIWNAPSEFFLDRADALNVDESLPPDQEIDFNPGDVLFIPRGEPHAAAVSSGHSVHLTIGLHTLTGLDLLGRMRMEAAKDPLLRMDLPRHSSKVEVDMHEAAVKKRIHQLVEASSVAQLLQEDDQDRLPCLQTAVFPAPPQTGDVLRLTLLRRIPLPAVAPGAAPPPITIGGKVCRLAPASIDVMQWLFDHDPTTRRTLDEGLSSRHRQSSIEAALRELSRFGFIVVNRAG
jgi:hypothetical protein